MNRSARDLFASTLTPSTLPPAPEPTKTAGPPAPPPPKDPRPFKPAGPDDDTAAEAPRRPPIKLINRGPADDPAPAPTEPRPSFADDIDRMAAAIVASGLVELDPATDQYRLRYVRRWREPTEEERSWITEEPAS